MRYNKVVTGVMIGLKTTKGSKTLKLAPQIYVSRLPEQTSFPAFVTDPYMRTGDRESETVRLAMFPVEEKM